jgi:hypothetical protein
MISNYKCTFGLKEGNSTSVAQKQNAQFIFKSVSFSAITPKLSCLQLRCCVNLRILWASPTVVPIRIRSYLFIHYTPETLLNHVFEDLRKPKAPNTPGIPGHQISPYGRAWQPAGLGAHGGKRCHERSPLFARGRSTGPTAQWAPNASCGSQQAAMWRDCPAGPWCQW